MSARTGRESPPLGFDGSELGTDGHGEVHRLWRHKEIELAAHDLLQELDAATAPAR